MQPNSKDQIFALSFNFGHTVVVGKLLSCCDSCTHRTGLVFFDQRLFSSKIHYRLDRLLAGIFEFSMLINTTMDITQIFNFTEIKTEITIESLFRNNRLMFNKMTQKNALKNKEVFCRTIKSTAH